MGRYKLWAVFPLVLALTVSIKELAESGANADVVWGRLHGDK